MTLLELHADVGRVADALEKIVFLLEKLVFPPPLGDVKVEQATLDDLHIVTEEDVIRMREEQQAFAERYQVVPNSPAEAQALIYWEEQQRSIYGEEWKAPDDWRAIMAQAGRESGPGRAQAEAAAQTADRI